MRYTNKQNLPEPYVRAVTNDDYDRGEEVDYTVTELLKPPRQLVLERRHDDELEKDVAEEAHRLFGRAMHNVLERAGIPERRFTITVLGKTVSGKPDRFTKDGLLQDWKSTSMYRFKGGQAPFEVEAQLNLYAEILRRNNFRHPTKLEAVPYLKDWSKRKALQDPELPRYAIIVVGAKLWTPEWCGKFLEQRVRLHEDAKRSLPECTFQERWSKGDKVAVMKKGRKKALKLCDTADQARDFIANHPDRAQLYTEPRRAENPRCEGYCDAYQVCEQIKCIQKAALEKCETCGKEKRPGKNGRPYCFYCWRNSKPY